MSIPYPDPSSDYDPETYSTVRLGTNPEAFNRPHNEPRRDDDDSNLLLPRWAVFLLVFIPLMLFCLGVTIYYLNRHRRTGMKRVTSPVELQDLQARHHPSPAPNLPELYWPGIYPPVPSPTGSECGPFPPPKADHEPQPPCKHFNHLDKSLPELPTRPGQDDADDWETEAGTSRNDLDFDQAFEQHRRDRKAEARANQRLFEKSFSHGQQKQQPQKPRVNDSYSQYRQYNMDFSGSDTDVILASDTNTMTNTFATTDRPNRARRQRGANDGFVPHRNLILDNMTETAAPSSAGFPSQDSEMSGFAETTLSDDPYGEDAARNRRLRR